MPKVKSFILSLMVALIAFSCQGKKADNNDKLDEAHKKIDQGNYSEAITILEDHQHTDSRPQVKISLASAYAGRAGVKIETLYKFVEEMKAPPITNEMIYVHPIFKNVQKLLITYGKILTPQMKSDVRTVGKMLSAFDLYKQKAESIPYVSIAGRSDLYKALEILSTVNTKGAKLYRATLGIVTLRSDLTDGFAVWNKTQKQLELGTEVTSDDDHRNLFCSVDIKSFPRWLSLQFDRVRGIATDLAVAYPSKSKELVSFDGNVQQLQKEIPRLNEELVPEFCL